MGRQVFTIQRLPGWEMCDLCGTSPTARLFRHKKYGWTVILAVSASNRGGLARIATQDKGTFWVRARSLGFQLWC